MADAKIFFILIVAVVLSAVFARWLAGRYRKRMVALMSGGGVPAAHSAVLAPASAPAAAQPRLAPALDRGQNRRAAVRLTVVLIGVSFVMALSMAWFNLSFAYAQDGYGPAKLLTLAAVYVWPAIPALGLLWRWPARRVVAASLAYMAAAGVLVWLRSIETPSIGGIALWLGLEVALPMTAVLLLAVSGKARAAAPYLLPLFMGLTGASVLGLDVLASAVGKPGDAVPPLLLHLVGTIGATATFLLFALAPWLLAAWPLRALTHWLAAHYRAKRFSELSYLFGGYWFVTLLWNALPSTHEIGFAAFALLGIWLWAPLGFRLLRGWLAAPAQPPTLLVLRVFRREEAVEALFDTVIERWRSSGNVLLIAGTDLALRTLDPDDLFTYLSGRLHTRFIGSQDDLDQRMAQLDLAPDVDGRFRVNECYCFDNTWQAALAALVARSDVVLMDLRGFRAENQGCLHELRVLSAAAAVRRVVVMYDGQTDRASAEATMGSGAQGRFVWLAASEFGPRTAAAVLDSLLDGVAGETGAPTSARRASSR